MIKKTIKTFFESESAIGILLLVSAVVAVIMANSDGYIPYQQFFTMSMPIRIDSIMYFKEMSIVDWINSGLMSIFFFLIGLELKRELMVGELSSRKKLAMPSIAALGGIVVPALIFTFLNRYDQKNIAAFAVPCATDIAFAYGAISLFGKRISESLKVFLVALAVLDDLVAIAIIAIFYAHEIQVFYLLLASNFVIALFLLNFFKVKRVELYVIFGILLWMAVLKSGVSTTVAGLITALFIPMKVGNKQIASNVVHQISSVVNFLILPLFVFANSGVRIDNFSFDIFHSKMVLGVIAGLFLGKQIGVMLFSFLAVKFKMAHLPRGANWFEFWGVAIFTGIGFTMSLFIGSLVYVGEDSWLFDLLKVGILCGSLLSAIMGFVVTTIATKNSK